MKEPVILCVDDEDIILKSLKRELHEALGKGYLIEIAEGGEEALEVFDELTGDGYEVPLVISDHIMPNMKGDALLRRIHERAPETLKIMLTGQADMQAVANAVNYARLYQYIAKPWEKAAFALTIKEALRSYSQAKELEEQRHNLQRSNQRLEQLNWAYERFVPREFLSFLNKKSIVDVRLGDQTQQEITIVFADIRSFTALSEEMSPQQNFDFLNTYLSRMGPIVREHDGFIDKYLGDGLMAIFPGRAEDAVQAAIDMQQALARHNLRHKPPIRIGIGIHRGNVMLGTIGEEQRMESTVISNAVNLASRLEGLTKEYGAAIIVSEHILNCLTQPQQFHARSLGRAQVKGRREAVALYEIYDGDAADMKQLKLETTVDFERGLHQYFARDFVGAAVFFQNVLRRNPRDTPARLFLGRSAELMVQSVPDSWQGVEMMEEK